jgi:hypothetical protein
MFRALRYPTFDRDDPGAAGDGAGFAPLAGTDGHEALERARQEAFEAGHAQGLAAGRAEARGQATAKLAEALPEALAALNAAAAEAGAVRQACERDAYLLVRAVLRQLLPTLADQGLGHEIAALVGEVVQNAPARTIEVRAAAATRGAIERLCGPAAAGISLTTDPALPEGSVSCRWTDGGARFDGHRIKESVLAILDRRLHELGRAPAAGSPRRHDDHPQTET